MIRTEILNEWFFPSVVRKDGRIIPAPEEAVEKYKDLRDGWLRNHPKLPKEKPFVDLSPKKRGNQEGYLVVTGIKYKPRS